MITSADHRAAPPAVLASWVQGHWGIENRAHWVRDVTFDEDRSQIRTGTGPHVMATLRNTAISLLRLAGATNIAASLRHHAAAADRPINLTADFMKRDFAPALPARAGPESPPRPRTTSTASVTATPTTPPWLPAG